MDCGTVVIGQVAHIPTLVEIGERVVAVIAHHRAFDTGDTHRPQSANDFLNDIGLAGQENRAEGGISHATDNDISLKTAVGDLSIEIHGCLEAETRPQQAQCGRRDNRLHGRSGDIGLFWAVTGDGARRVQINDQNSKRGITQRAL